MSKKAKEALFIGLLCAVSYLAVYVARNVLSTVTPQMVENGEFTKEYIGNVSSLFFTFYAIGQLFNGFLGEKIKARYMMSVGLFAAGVINFVFPYIMDMPGVAKYAYGMTGFFLSMIYAPMTKLVAENTHPDYSTKCSLSYSLASYVGSPIAGAIAAILTWRSSFTVSSIALLVMAIACFTCFYWLEKQGVIVHNRFAELKKENKTRKNPVDVAKILVKRHIIIFSLVSILTGVVRTAVVFWLPTYFNEYLGYSPKTAAAIFTVATLAISLTVFVAVFAYKLMKQNMYKTLFITYLGSCVSFLAVFFVNQPILNVVFIVFAVMLSNSAATILWSMYCPSLRDTGVVSTATGFLTFIGYIASSISSSAFANSVATIGWGKLILVWALLMGIGVISIMPYLIPKRHKRHLEH